MRKGHPRQTQLNDVGKEIMGTGIHGLFAHLETGEQDLLVKDSNFSWLNIPYSLLNDGDYIVN